MHCKSREIRQKGKKTLKLVFSYCKRFYLQEEFQYQVGAANVTQGAIRRVLHLPVRQVSTMARHE